MSQKPKELAGTVAFETIFGKIAIVIGWRLNPNVFNQGVSIVLRNEIDATD